MEEVERRSRRRGKFWVGQVARSVDWISSETEIAKCGFAAQGLKEGPVRQWHTREVDKMLF